MARRSNHTLIIAVSLLLLLIFVGIAAWTAHRAVSPLLRLPLTYEESSGIVLAKGSVQQGYVYLIEWTSNGWAFAVKPNVRLVEKITMENIDLQVNDVIAPHLYDAVVVYAGDPSNKYDSARIYFENATNSYLDLPPDVTVACLGQFKYTVGFYSDDSYAFGIFEAQAAWGIALEYATEGSASNQWTTLYRAIQFPPGINPPFYDRLTYFWFQKDYQNENVTTITWKDELGNVKSITKDLSTDATLAGRFGNGHVAAYHVTIFNRELNAGDPTTGRIAFLAVYNGLFDPEVGSGDNLLLLFDPTMYNGTHYFLVARDPTTGAQIPYEMTGIRYVERLPAERSFLWHIQQLGSDNKLHLRFFPAGSIIRVKSAGNVIREYVVPQELANAAGLVEDYAVDLGATVLPSVSVEASIPSMKARIYGPPGFAVRVESEEYAQTYTIGSQGYVDVVLPDKEASVELVASDKQPGIGISAYSGDKLLKVQIYNESSGVALANAVVVAKKNNQVASAITDSNGFAELNMEADAPINLEAYYLSSGVVYTGSTVYSPPPAETLPETSSGNRGAALLLLLLPVLLLVTVLRRGRR